MSTFDYVKDCWYPIGFSGEFPEGQLQGHKIVNRPIVMWRSDKAEVVAFDDRCCHKRFPLSQSAYFTPSWTRISRQAGQAFHTKLDTDFTASWTAISRQAGQ
ncbi:Rieske [2Fe-2S] domain-containing protein [Caballeronia arationis]|uniref:Rieske [2Fe-2S] domain-containing protein n=1 Tax=Caballeronia arationis TaxID=1777142 RepID=A0A7Z7N175_9BURK|nr:Rieske (2Fe-2S) protein [Caballeronia arationis]SOE57054.1 Rieske [2Fe-2S] domain-containing protein [Caballeronia arationis]